MKVFPLKSGKRQGCPLSPIIIQLSFESPSYINQRRKTKGIQIEKEIKLSLFTDDMILCTGNSKDVTRKFLKLISEYSKVAGYKINIQKSLNSYTLKMKNQTKKLRKQSHSSLK